VTVSDHLSEVRIQGILDTLSLKKRIRYLQSVAAEIGDPQVIPFGPVDKVRGIMAARNTWARLAPSLFIYAMTCKTAPERGGLAVAPDQPMQREERG
jgi:hypothetical protein